MNIHCLQCYQVSGPLVLTSDTYSCFYSMHNPGYLSFNTNAELILFVLVFQHEVFVTTVICVTHRTENVSMVFEKVQKIDK